MPWIAEKILYWGESDSDVPSTAYVRAFRVLRILKTDRFTGAADALGRVFYVNMHILGVAGVLAARLVLVMSSLLCVTRARGRVSSRRCYPVATTHTGTTPDDGAEGFESIPATMYLSILMLTGQGEPGRRVDDATEVALRVHGHLLGGHGRHSRVDADVRLRDRGAALSLEAARAAAAARRIRATIERLENHWIESCSDSEDGDAHFLARERQRQSRCRGGRRADASDLSSSEEEYETLVLGETQEATLERVRSELQAKQAQYDSLLRAMEDAPPAVL